MKRNKRKICSFTK